MTIRRETETQYSVTTDTVMSDGSYRADDNCALVGGMLRSVESKSDIRTLGILRVTLGPKSFVIVKNLAIGQSVKL